MGCVVVVVTHCLSLSHIQSLGYKIEMSSSLSLFAAVIVSCKVMMTMGKLWVREEEGEDEIRREGKRDVIACCRCRR